MKYDVSLDYKYAMKELIEKNITNNNQESQEILNNINEILFNNCNYSCRLSNQIYKIIKESQYNLNNFIFKIAKIIYDVNLYPRTTIEGDCKREFLANLFGYIGKDEEFSTEYKVFPEYIEMDIMSLDNPYDTRDTVKYTSLDEAIKNDNASKKYLTKQFLKIILTAFKTTIERTNEKIEEINSIINNNLITDVKFLQQSNLMYDFLDENCNAKIRNITRTLNKLKEVLK